MDNNTAFQHKLITDVQLKPFMTNGNSDLADKARSLLIQQKSVWPLLEKGYSSLSRVETRNFEFDGFNVKVQFNPGRIVSSSAKVDAKSIAERKCFLCYNNLPEEQKGLPFGTSYLLLGNPFPIFNEHFTIPESEHVAQQLNGSFAQALDLSRELGKYYTVFYNGPKCGASAPDHLHFQAGDKHFMPIDSEYDTIKTTKGSLIFESDALKVYAVDNYLRRFFSFESSDRQVLIDKYADFLREYSALSASADEEPMMNALFYYEDGLWRVIIFPRAKHRPSHYFAEGDNNILLSPASVDMGGVMITPLEKDFQKITSDDIASIFREVTATDEVFGKLKDVLNH